MCVGVDNVTGNRSLNYKRKKEYDKKISRAAQYTSHLLVIMMILHSISNSPDVRSIIPTEMISVQLVTADVYP